MVDIKLSPSNIPPLSRFDTYLLHFANALVCGTGLVYAWMLYFMEPEDEFSILNHPLQADVQAWHILAAPLLVFAAAILWKSHACARLQQQRKRKRGSGIGLSIGLFPMIFSAYLLQTAIDENWQEVWRTVHLMTSGLWLAASLIHLLPARKFGSR